MRQQKTYVENNQCNNNSHLMTSFQGQVGFAGATTMDFKESTDDRVKAASAGPCASHLHLAPER